MERRNFLKQAIVTAAGSALLPGITKAGAFWEDTPLVIDGKGPGKGFTNFWTKTVGAGRASEGLRANWLEQLQFSKKHCGFEYARLHGIFHDDMFVIKNNNGTTVYNWQYVDEVYDKMLKSGVKPFVELSFFPKDISSGQSSQLWWKAHVTPPADFVKWTDLVTSFAKHCIERFGIEEVSTWYFEVWNEPDQRAFWDGTKAQYFELYKASATALKAVSPRLRVGGPATGSFGADGKGVWIEEFLAYCAGEKLPVDFVSTHPYPANGGQPRELDATSKDLLWLNGVVRKSPFPQAEIHCTEWNSSASVHDAMHDGLPVAAYIVKVNADSIGLVDSLAYSSFSDGYDETGAGDAFHGGVGLVNNFSIPKPSFHAYRMLHAMGDELLYNKDGIVVTRHKDSKRLSAILYNLPAAIKTVPMGAADALFSVGEDKAFNFKLTGTHPDARFNVEILDRDNGNALKAFKDAGSPESPAKDQIQTLQQMAMAVKEAQILASTTGILQVGMTLRSWDVVLIDEVK
ncbi:hypothetical protein GO495_00330 [Chitinophaga oryziterrae]|uniref:Glycosyl hydrolases family 39 N-terminal catalytic domain-containing protein n=1 Tax=Chitinophaga oryziterrae TaxID=1031224 RepID=A0A6N8J1W9_9BACT|nr:glycosyl hydrolase [Chitinophaga oryziterrae]MVT39013.1 hypothetical protein [Chitinophaga oryziterrae]